MIPLKQTTETNCFQAVLASILELPIESVSSAFDGGSWDFDKQVQWFTAQGICFVEFEVHKDDYFVFPINTYCVMTFKSPRRPGELHAVVGLSNESKVEAHFDPHPDAVDGELHSPVFVGLLYPTCKTSLLWDGDALLTLVKAKDVATTVASDSQSNE